MVWKSELIGSFVEVVGSKNRSLIGLAGKVIDETKYTLVIENEKRKRIMKTQVTLKIGNKTVRGISIVGHSGDRLK